MAGDVVVAALWAGLAALALRPPWAAVGLIPAVIVGLAIAGAWSPARITDSVALVRVVLRAALVPIGVVLLAPFVQPGIAGSRGGLLASLAAGVVLLVAWRLVFFRFQRMVPRGDGVGVVVIGVGEEAALAARRIAADPTQQLVLRGFLAPAGSDPPQVEPVLGNLDELRAVVNAHRVEVVVLASRRLGREEALPLTSLCGAMGLRVLQVPFTWGLVAAKVQASSLGALELVELGGLEYPSLAQGMKRVFDLVAVFAGGLVILPLLAVVAIAVKLQDGGPILYASQRSGKGGRAFWFYKFRSMVPGAEEGRDDLDNEADGRLFKVADDPRVTPLGRVLRRWSIDELPQLLNVLRGDMNLVGPRPLVLRDLEGIERDPEHWFWFEQRSRVKPGITGLWQVAGRSDLPFEAMVDLDVRYIQEWSLLLDLRILLQTIPAVLRGRGAR